MPHVYHSEITTIYILLFSLLVYVCVCKYIYVCVCLWSLPQWVHIDHAFLVFSFFQLPSSFCVTQGLSYLLPSPHSQSPVFPQHLLGLVSLNQDSV